MLTNHSIRRFIYTLSIVFCLAALSGISEASFANQDWLWSRSPTIAKQQDLAASTPVYTPGYDCEPVSFRVANKSTNPLLKSCQYVMPFGTVSRSGVLLSGAEGPYMYRINGIDTQAHPYVVGDLLYVLRTDSNGTQVWAYDISSPPTIIKQVYSDGISTSYRYEITYPAAKPVKKTDGSIVSVGSLRLYFSANQKWVSYVDGSGALTIADTASWQTKTIYKPSGLSLYESDQDGGTLAVSDDGKFIAANPITKTNDRSYAVLWLFDTATCHNQAPNISGKKPLNTCEYNDLWQGVFRGQTYDGSLKSRFSSGAFPRNMRFAANGALVFDTKVNVAGANYSVERHQVSSGINEARQYVSVLGMGDSYISGEGAHAYRLGTDTADNKCHTSVLSYPVITTNKFLPGAQTVACSGAKIFDIDAGLWGDSKLKLSYGGQTKSKIDWDKRSDSLKTSIMNDFSPGYANQVLFIEKYQPRTILLSIGGNNIHFADIVAQCVSPINIDTCYYYQEDRIELMQTIIDHYDDLVRLYRDTAESSPGTTVYVVGYPQVAKAGGKCGANVLLNDTEIVFSNRLITYLNATIKRAASDAGVVYVDTERALDKYQLCEAPKGMAAVNGFTVGRDSGLSALRIIGQESYHPTAYGHALLAKSIELATNNLTLPMPTSRTNMGKPTIDPKDPLINGVVANGRRVNSLVWRSKPQMLYQVGKKYLFRHPTDIGTSVANRAYKLVLRSDPVVLSEGYATNDAIEVTIPAGLPSGYHTLDYYTIDTAGKPIDVRQVIYAATAADLETGQCLGLPTTGSDSDADGVDDACDGDSDTSNANVVTDLASQSDEDMLVSIPPLESAPILESVLAPQVPQTSPAAAVAPTKVGTTTISAASTMSLSKILPAETTPNTSWTDWVDDSVVTTTPTVLGAVAPGAKPVVTYPKQSPTNKEHRLIPTWVVVAAGLVMVFGLAKKTKRH